MAKTVTWCNVDESKAREIACTPRAECPVCRMTETYAAQSVTDILGLRLASRGLLRRFERKMIARAYVISARARSGSGTVSGFWQALMSCARGVLRGQDRSQNRVETVCCHLLVGSIFGTGEDLEHVSPGEFSLPRVWSHRQTLAPAFPQRLTVAVVRFRAATVCNGSQVGGFFVRQAWRGVGRSAVQSADEFVTWPDLPRWIACHQPVSFRHRENG